MTRITGEWRSGEPQLRPRLANPGSDAKRKSERRPPTRKVGHEDEKQAKERGRGRFATQPRLRELPDPRLAYLGSISEDESDGAPE